MKLLIENWREYLHENDDRCTRIAKSKYDVWPSAYASGAVVRCRQGKIWKGIKEEDGQALDCPTPTQDLELNTKNRNAAINAEHIQYGPLNIGDEEYWFSAAEHWNTTPEVAKKSKFSNCVAFDISPRMEECMPGSVQEDGQLGYCWMHHFKCHSARTCYTWAAGGPITEDATSREWQEKNQQTLEEEEGLRKWFGRKGAKGSESGWVDCNTCRKDKKTGKTTCKSCGRQEGEKRSKYPACRPTPSACKDKGKGKSWGKKAKKEALDVTLTREEIKNIVLEEMGELVYNHITDATLDDGTVVEDLEFWDDVLEEAEYKGRKVTLNKPMRGDVKKSKVYVKNAKGNIVKVNFGDPDMKIKKSDPKRRKSFRARHNCDNPGPKWKARYWSCKAW